MNRFPQRPGVTSRMRLRGHDYSEPGLYFITVCINDWTHRLGEVVEDEFVANDAGQMVSALWDSMPSRFAGASLDARCVMPNHFHGLVGIGLSDGAKPPFPSIPSIMNWFKSSTTVEYIRGVKELDWPRYEKRLWLDGYHDHVVRNERDLVRIRAYIASNPAQWRRDGFYGR